MDALGNKCVCCGSTDNLEIDHIDRIKFSSKERWGDITRRYRENDLSGLQVLCKPCNASKSRYKKCRIHRDEVKVSTPAELMEWANQLLTKFNSR